MITADHLLNTTITVRRRVTQSDGVGGQESEWTTLGESPARVSQPPPGELLVIAGQTKRDLTHRVYFPAGTDIVRGDRVLTAGGAELAVESVLDPSEPAYRRAQCVLAQEGN